MTQRIRVLHVEDEPGLAELVADYLTELDNRFTVTSASNTSEGLGRLGEEEFDCIVSDYEMSGRNGIEFLEAVRTEYPNLPFILYTGKGSEEVASDAISAGVTDYLQKEAGTGQYEILANRIVNAVERRRAEKQAESWTRAVETANEGIAIINEDGRYAEVNDAYAALYGTEPDALIGEPWTVTVPEEEANRLMEDVLPTLDEAAWSDESIGARVDGDVYPKLLSLAALENGGHVCIIRDISEQKEREAELQRRADKLEVLFENSPDLIDVHDAEGKLVDVNDRLCTALGYSEEELLGKPVWQIDRVADPESVKKIWDEMEIGEQRELTGEYQRRDGSVFPVEVHLRKVRLSGQDRFFVIARDISDRREQQRQLEQKNEQLEQFASVVSHDLRNPLTVATGRLELVQQEYTSDHHDVIATALDRMGRIIDNVLWLAREGREIGETGPVDFQAVVESAWRMMPDKTENTDLRYVDESGEGTIEADEDRLSQLLENLFRNAIEHSNSPVTIRVELTETGFIIEDDGPGIPFEERDKVFQPGYSNAKEGTGFGLQIAKKVVEAHGWDIHLTESSDDGTRFEITGVQLL